MKEQPFTPKRWKRVAYERLVDLGAFNGEPLELIGGQLMVAEPQGTRHMATIGCVGEALRLALPSGWIVRIQGPIDLDEESVPEPDLAVVPGTHADYRAAHPARPVLAVEVAETSGGFDRRQKSSLYARGGLEDYWIVDVVDRLLEVHRDPVPDPSAPYGWRYRSVASFVPPAVVALLALPSARVAVADLLAAA